MPEEEEKKRKGVPRRTMAAGLVASGVLCVGGTAGIVLDTPTNHSFSSISALKQVADGDINPQAVVEIGFALAGAMGVLLTARAIKIGLDAEQPLLSAGHIATIGNSAALIFWQYPFVRALSFFANAIYLLGQSNQLRADANPTKGTSFNLRPLLQVFTPKNIHDLLPGISDAESEKLSGLAVQAIRGNRKAVYAFKALTVKIMEQAAKESSGLGSYFSTSMGRVWSPHKILRGPIQEMITVFKKEPADLIKENPAVTDLASQMSIFAGSLLVSGSPDLQQMGLGIGFTATFLAMHPLLWKGGGNLEEPWGPSLFGGGVFTTIGRIQAAIANPFWAAIFRSVEGIGALLWQNGSIGDTNEQNALKKCLNALSMYVDIRETGSELLARLAEEEKGPNLTVAFNKALKSLERDIQGDPEHPGTAKLQADIRSEMSKLGKRGRKQLGTVLNKAEADRIQFGIPLSLGFEIAQIAPSEKKVFQMLLKESRQIPFEPGRNVVDDAAVQAAKQSIDIEKYKNSPRYMRNIWGLLEPYRTLRRNNSGLPQEDRKQIQEWAEAEVRDLGVRFTDMHTKHAKTREQGIKDGYFGTFVIRMFTLLDLYFDCFKGVQTDDPLLAEVEKRMSQQSDYARTLEIDDRAGFEEAAEYSIKVMDTVENQVNAYGLLIKEDLIAANDENAYALRTIIKDGFSVLGILDQKLTSACISHPEFGFHRKYPFLNNVVAAELNRLKRRYNQFLNMKVPPNLFELAVSGH